MPLFARGAAAVGVGGSGRPFATARHRLGAHRRVIVAEALGGHEAEADEAVLVPNVVVLNAEAAAGVPPEASKGLVCGR